ncbi:MAG: GNAT family N-acetyltransferase [Bacillaceae bacterium]|nr:GNAT family N-acetyltransferase [Bacillaceae bacterium]
MSIVVRLATQDDLETIRGLLRKGRLNTEGIDEHLDHFLVVEDVNHQKIVGTAGMEIWGKHGLLRSLAMASESWNARVGLELVRIMLNFARKKQVQDLYLITASSYEFFQNLGFQPIGLEQVPDSLKTSSHFKQYQPEWMRIMVYHFPQ